MAPAANSATIAKTSSEKCEIDKKRKDKEKEKKPVNAIEEIFRAAMKKRKEQPQPAQPASSSSAETKANKKSAKKKIKKEPKKSEDELSSRKRRKTADGLSIYSAKELGIGNPDAGDTPLCPFDCSCCF